MAVTLDAGDKLPLLLLIIPAPPPVPVKNLGRIHPRKAIEIALPEVLAKTEHHPLDLSTLAEKIPQTAAWVTWEQLRAAVERAHQTFETDDESVQGTISRLCELVAESINRHGAPR